MANSGPSHAALPSKHLLRAAVRVLRCLTHPQTLRGQLHSSYPLLPTEGVFCVEDFRAAEDLLVSTGIVSVRDDRFLVAAEVVAIGAADEMAAAELLLARVLIERPPAWLSAAALGDALRVEFIPDADLTAISSTLESAEAREALLLSMGERVDPLALSALGNAGEEHVISLCRAILERKGRPDLVPAVQRVSLVSDRLGYDIVCPTTMEGLVRLEVKTMAGRGPDAECYLSRNESVVAARDPRWRLVVCSQGADGPVTLLGWCGFHDFADDLPADRTARGRWHSVRLRIPQRLLQPHIDALL